MTTWMEAHESSEHEAVHAGVATALGLHILSIERRADDFDLPGRRLGATTVDPAALIGHPVEEMMCVLGPAEYSVETAKLSGADLDRVNDIERAHPGTKDIAQKRLRELFKTRPFIDARTAFSDALWKKGKLDENDISHVLGKEIE